MFRASPPTRQAIQVHGRVIDHYDRRLTLSDARIEPFTGLVDCGAPPDPALLRDVTRICEQLAKERMGGQEREGQLLNENRCP